MDDIKRFQVLLVLILENIINFAHPLHRRMVIAFRQSVEIEDYVVPFNERVQQRYQIQQRLMVSKVNKTILNPVRQLFFYPHSYGWLSY